MSELLRPIQDEQPIIIDWEEDIESIIAFVAFDNVNFTDAAGYYFSGKNQPEVPEFDAETLNIGLGKIEDYLQKGE